VSDVDAPHAPTDLLVAQAFVAAAGTVGDDVDVDGAIARLTSGCRSARPDADAGVIARDVDGELRLATGSAWHLQLLERIAIPYDEGPLLDCARSGEPVVCRDLRDAIGRWPAFANATIETGYHSVHALPLRHGTAVIGAVELLRAQTGEIASASIALLQALADVTTVGILRQRATVEARNRVEQLEGALASRVTIEQAKGILAAHSGRDPESAFEDLRGYARARNERLAEVAAAIVARTLAATSVVGAAS
jgi:GAF domain-containing protein